MDLEGRFTSPEGLATVMKTLSGEFMTGVLTLRCGTTPVTFDYSRGKISGSSNSQRPHRLGRILLNRGLIDRVALNEALAYQEDFSPSTSLGRVLVHRDRLSLDNVREALRLQIEEELTDALACRDGYYQFDPVEIAPEETPLVEEDSVELIDQILNRRDEWDELRKQFPDDSMIPSVVKLAGPSDREMLHLNSREWHVLSLINGLYDIGCIAARSGLGTFESFRVLASLSANGLITMHQSADPAMSHKSGNHDAPHTEGGTDSASAGTSSSRWGSLMSRLRDEPDPVSTQDGRLEFDSPVPFLVEICNQVLGQLITNQDFIVDPSDERLAERHWRQILMSYPKADLVSATMNTLDAVSFDRYTRTLGVDGAMKSIYLETMEALTRYLRTVYLLSAQRLGSRAARTLFVNVMEDVRRRSTIGHSESFFFKEEAARILE